MLCISGPVQFKHLFKGQLKFIISSKQHKKWACFSGLWPIGSSSVEQLDPYIVGILRVFLIAFLLVCVFIIFPQLFIFQNFSPNVEIN